MESQLAGGSEGRGESASAGWGVAVWWEMLSGTSFGGVARLGRYFPRSDILHFPCRTTHYSWSVEQLQSFDEYRGMRCL
jgi:hypothetical protein